MCGGARHYGKGTPETRGRPLSLQNSASLARYGHSTLVTVFSAQKSAPRTIITHPPVSLRGYVGTGTILKAAQQTAMHRNRKSTHLDIWTYSGVLRGRQVCIWTNEHVNCVQCQWTSFFPEFCCFRSSFFFSSAKLIFPHFFLATKTACLGHILT